MSKLLGLVSDLQQRLQKAADSKELPPTVVAEAAPERPAATAPEEKPEAVDENATVRAPSPASGEASDGEESVASDKESERLAEHEALLEAQEEAKAETKKTREEALKAAKARDLEQASRPVATPVPSFEPPEMDEDAHSNCAMIPEPSMPASSGTHKREYMRLEAGPLYLVELFTGFTTLATIV